LGVEKYFPHNFESVSCISFCAGAGTQDIVLINSSYMTAGNTQREGENVCAVYLLDMFLWDFFNLSLKTNVPRESL
jgi:hypothetical protein